MDKKYIYIGGGLLLVGGLAFLYFKNKDIKVPEIPNLETSTTPTTTTTTTPTTVTQTTDPVTGLPIKPVVKKLSDEDLSAINSLREEILSEISKRNSYKKASSRANVQSEIDKKMIKLKAFGYALDNQNKLIKIS
jgi:hypothetical protein